MNNYLIILKNWLPYAAVITLVCGIIYIATQQNFRSTANDPQYQLVEDGAAAINKGTDPKSLITAGSAIEISGSLAPFMVIYDATGSLIASNANLDGRALTIPKGVLTYIHDHGSDAATWQPRPGVRLAMVGIISNAGEIVIAGRSLRKVEERIAQLGEQVLFGWGCSLVGLLIVVIFQDWMTKKYIQP
ncbi:MAG TPA: hypothetical protein VNW95_15765 [Mucilaginibacter sp.]|jgi:hypothetical protein|nr:hypothetical protein [Mucilaginibacter sp.]